MCGYGRRIHYFYGENYKSYSTEYKVEMIEPGRFSFRNFWSSSKVLWKNLQRYGLMSRKFIKYMFKS